MILIHIYTSWNKVLAWKKKSRLDSQLANIMSNRRILCYHNENPVTLNKKKLFIHLKECIKAKSPFTMQLFEKFRIK